MITACHLSEWNRQQAVCVAMSHSTTTATHGRSCSLNCASKTYSGNSTVRTHTTVRENANMHAHAHARAHTSARAQGTRPCSHALLLARLLSCKRHAKARIPRRPTWHRSAVPMQACECSVGMYHCYQGAINAIPKPFPAIDCYTASYTGCPRAPISTGAQLQHRQL